MTKPSKNVLTNQLVTKLYDALTAGAKISRPKFEKEDLGQALSTIFQINSLTQDDKTFQGTSIKEWEIPEAFDLLLFPEISLSGGINEIPLVEWDDESDYIPYDESEMLEFTRRFYATYRSAPKTIQIYTVKSLKQGIADFIPNLCLDGERVTDSFKAGSYPVHSNMEFFKDYAEGIKISKAQELFVDAILSKLQ